MPFVFTAASLLAKDPKTGQAVPWNPSPQHFIDGSVDNDIPMTRLAEMFNVNHFIVSQVNPHVVPFLMKEEGLIGRGAPQVSPDVPVGSSWLDSLSQLAKGEALYRMQTLAELGIFPNLLTKTVSVLSQKYSGDITILPEINYADFPRMLSNPTPEFMHQAMICGERATWPKMSIIKNHCAIELALDDAVQKLRARVVFSPSEIESRLKSQVKRNSYTGSQKTMRRRRSSKHRPLSQHSAQEPLEGRLPSAHSDHRQTSLHTTHKTAGRITPVLRHKKSGSLGTIPLPSATNPKTSPDSLSTSKSPQDLTSSGAEGSSNITSESSSTSLNLSSPVESPSPIDEPPPKWHRSLFGSTSQPNTPSQTSSSTPTTPKASHPGLTMTPTGNKSGAESKYKRLFHNKPSPDQPAPSSMQGQQRKTAKSTKAMSGSGSDSAKSEGGSMRKTWGLEIDIPNTAKGLVGRGKKKGGGD